MAGFKPGTLIPESEEAYHCATRSRGGGGGGLQVGTQPFRTSSVCHSMEEAGK